MIGLSAGALLKTWETARDRPPALQALALLGTALPGADDEQLARLSLGQRDAWLLVLREGWFGTRLDCVATCPRCGQRSEFSLSTPALLGEMPAEHAQDEYTFDADGYHVRFRLPDSTDLEAASHCRDERHAHEVLLSRVVLEARLDGEPVDATALSIAAIEALEVEIAEQDPLAEILIDLRCPTCEHTWQSPLDVASALFMELSSRARQLLRDVHTIARHYHWSEAEILALSAARRQAYLELVTE